MRILSFRRVDWLFILAGLLEGSWEFALGSGEGTEGVWGIGAVVTTHLLPVLPVHLRSNPHLRP